MKTVAIIGLALGFSFAGVVTAQDGLIQGGNVRRRDVGAPRAKLSHFAQALNARQQGAASYLRGAQESYRIKTGFALRLRMVWNKTLAALASTVWEPKRLHPVDASVEHA